MPLTKKQCKEILKQAKAADACEENYLPAKAAYKAGDYETFEKICRGNIDWLKGNGVNITQFITDAGPIISHSLNYITHGFVDEGDDSVGIELVYNKKTNTLCQLRSYNEYQSSAYMLIQEDGFTPETANFHLKNIADAIYKHLENSITVTNV